MESKGRKSILASVYNRIGVGKGARWSLKNLLSPIYGSGFLFVFLEFPTKRFFFGGWGEVILKFGEVEQGSVPTV